LRIYQHGNPRIQAPQILGHEIAGEIVEIGDKVTDLVVQYNQLMKESAHY